MRHIQEGSRTPPPYHDFSFAEYREKIPIPKIAQENQCDYEGELCVAIGKTGINIKEQTYVGRYFSGNDFSARTWQRNPAYVGGVPQWVLIRVLISTLHRVALQWE